MKLSHIALLLLLPPCAIADTPVQPFRAEYSVHRNNVKIAGSTLALEFRHDGGYSYRIRTKPAGLIAMLRSGVVSESCEGTIRENRTVPLRYRYMDNNAGRDLHLLFDWKKQSIEHRVNDDPPWFLDMEGEVQDKMSQQLNLILALNSGKKSLLMQVADGGKLLPYGYSVIAEEAVKTPAGRFDTLKVKRSKAGKPSQLTMWVSKDIGYIPVQVNRIKGDNVFSMRLTKLSRGSKIENPARKAARTPADAFKAWGE